MQKELYELREKLIVYLTILEEKIGYTEELKKK